MSSLWTGTWRMALAFLSCWPMRMLRSKIQMLSTCRRSASRSWQISSWRIPEKTAIRGSQNFSSRKITEPDFDRQLAARPDGRGEQCLKFVLLPHLALVAGALAGGELPVGEDIGIGAPVFDHGCPERGERSEMPLHSARG